MNPEFYTEEFRDFKFLKSSPQLIEYYKARERLINQVQEWDSDNDPTFVWPHRVEFLEQLIDLKNDVVYFVSPVADTTHGPSRLYPDSPTMYEIENPRIYKGNVIQPRLGKLITYEDVSSVENDLGIGWCLCSQEFYNNIENGYAFKLDRSFIFSGLLYSAMFCDKDTAENYRRCLEAFLSKTADAVSVFSRLV